MKKLLSTLMCLILVFASCAALADPVVMKYAGTTTADPELGEYQAMLKFEELVEEYSGGEIDVEVYPASQLGGSVEFTEGTALGNLAAQMIADGAFADLAAFRAALPGSFEIREYRPKA